MKTKHMGHCGQAVSTSPYSPPLRTSRPPSCRTHISQNIEAIKALHAHADENLSRYQRPIETVGMLLGRPTFFYGIVLCVVMWVLINVFAPRFGVALFNPAPYYWLQGIVGLGAWLTATIVLITQTRQGKLAEQRAHLDLQVRLL
jgi:uncharacterized membrane protein